MDVTLYIFDALNRRVRAVVPENGCSELIHDEENNRVNATIAASLGAENGEAIGFRCVDGRFRLFEIIKTETEDDRGITLITGRDLAVYDLDHMIIEELQQLDVKADEAVAALIMGSGWAIGTVVETAAEKSRAYYQSVWSMLEAYKELYKVRFAAYYEFENGGITRGVIDIEEDVAYYRGRILQSEHDASKVYTVRDGSPVTRLYGLGPSTSSGEVQTNLTFAGVAWSVAGGDPADKPREQTWVEDTEAVKKYGVRAEVVKINEVAGETEQEQKEDLLQKTWEELQRRICPSVTASAVVQDLEMLPGHEHQMIRLGDLVIVELKNGSNVEARIIGIKRNYLRPDLTKIKVGEKTATISGQVGTLINNALHTFERLTVYKNRFHEDEALIQLNALYIQQNAEQIDLNANEINLLAYNINIAGYLTVYDNATVVGMLNGTAITCESLTANTSLWTEYLSAYEVGASSIKVDGEYAAWNDKTVVAQISPVVTKKPITYMTADGGTASVDVVTGIEWNKSSTTIRYLGK